MRADCRGWDWHWLGNSGASIIQSLVQRATAWSTFTGDLWLSAGWLIEQTCGAQWWSNQSERLFLLEHTVVLSTVYVKEVMSQCPASRLHMSNGLFTTFWERLGSLRRDTLNQELNVLAFQICSHSQFTLIEWVNACLESYCGAKLARVGKIWRHIRFHQPVCLRTEFISKM